jgi:hypothetical protein
VDTHPTLRIQFFLDGPFDPIGTLSCTFLDSQMVEVESITLGGEFPQYELWQKVAEMAASFMATYGSQSQLELD